MKRGFWILVIYILFIGIFISCNNSPLLLEESLSISNIQSEGFMKKERKGKAKLEYSINEKKGHQQGFDYPFIMHINLTNDTLIINYSGELSNANFFIKDSKEEVIIDERLVFINKEKVNKIYPADSFPYFIEITSPDTDVKGVIKLVGDDEADEE